MGGKEILIEWYLGFHWFRDVRAHLNVYVSFWISESRREAIQSFNNYYQFPNLEVQEVLAGLEVQRTPWPPILLPLRPHSRNRLHAELVCSLRLQASRQKPVLEQEQYQNRRSLRLLMAWHRLQRPLVRHYWTHKFPVFRVSQAGQAGLGVLWGRAEM